MVPTKHVLKSGSMPSYYTPMILNVSMVSVLNLQILFSLNIKTLTDYMGKIHFVVFHEFNELLPPSPDPATEIEQCSKFFILGALHGLVDKYSHIRDQILGSPVVSTLASTCSTLLQCTTTTQHWYTCFCWWFFCLASHRDDRTRLCK